MIIKRNEMDKNYPFEICGSWDDVVFASLEDLKELKKQINKILKEEGKKIK